MVSKRVEELVEYICEQIQTSAALKAKAYIKSEDYDSLNKEQKEDLLICLDICLLKISQFELMGQKLYMIEGV